MPTTEEYEKKIASLEGQLAAIKADKDTALEQVRAHSTENVALKDRLKKFEDGIRKNIEDRVHSFVKDYDCTNKSNEVLEEFCHGFELAKKEKGDKPESKEHSVAAGSPQLSTPATTTDQKPKTTSQKLKELCF